MAHEQADPTSLTLLIRFGNGSEDLEAWKRFVDLYGPRIWGWCRRWGLQDADASDATQNVLLRLAKELRAFRYDPSRSFRGRLRTVTRHALSDFLADRERQCRGSGDDRILEQLRGVEARDDLLARLDNRFDAEVMAVACARVRARVEARTWEAFRLTAHEGPSGDEVAARLGMTRDGVFKAKSRIMAWLREEITRLDEP